MKRKILSKGTERFDIKKHLLPMICVGILIYGVIFYALMGIEYVQRTSAQKRIRDIYRSACNEYGSAAKEEFNVEYEKLGVRIVSGNVEDAGEYMSENEIRYIQPEFIDLYKENPDISGWIEIGDIVNDPVLWRDNEFYMDHGFDGEENFAGAIFLDERNKRDMTDDAIIIYGHNMKDGSMFGDLDKFREWNYLKKHPVIEVHTAWEPETRKYVIISLFDASMNWEDSSYINIIRTEFDDVSERNEFVDEMCARSLFDIDIDKGSDERLLTLVTCSYSHDNGRLVILARELKENESEKEIKESFKNMR